MREAISLFVTFVLIAIIYELTKPKNDYQSTNHHIDKEED